MKNSFKLHEAQEAKKEKDLADWVPKQACCVCSTALSGAYGRHMKNDQELWTCSGKCERNFTQSKEVEDADDSL
jgi:hypothetical protein